MFDSLLLSRRLCVLVGSFVCVLCLILCVVDSLFVCLCDCVRD